MSDDGEGYEEEHFFTKADLADRGSEEDGDEFDGEEDDEDDDDEEEYIIGNGGGNEKHTKSSSSSSSRSSCSSSQDGSCLASKRPRSSEDGPNLEGKKKGGEMKRNTASSTPNNFSTIDNLATHQWNKTGDTTGDGNGNSADGNDVSSPPPVLECIVEAGEVITNSFE